MSDAAGKGAVDNSANLRVHINVRRNLDTETSLAASAARVRNVYLLNPAESLIEPPRSQRSIAYRHDPVRETSGKLRKKLLTVCVKNDTICITLGRRRVAPGILVFKKRGR